MMYTVAKAAVGIELQLRDWEMIANEGSHALPTRQLVVAGSRLFVFIIPEASPPFGNLCNILPNLNNSAIRYVDDFAYLEKRCKS